LLRISVETRISLPAVMNSSTVTGLEFTADSATGALIAGSQSLHREKRSFFGLLSFLGSIL
jgi:hypothetical protein